MEKTLKLLMTLLLFAAITPAVSADFSYEMRNARPGASEPTISRTWMSDTAFRMEPDPKTVQIISFATRELIEMNVPEKTYRVTKFDDIAIPPAEQPADPKAPAGNTLTRMVEGMEATRTEEKQDINGHNCVLVKTTIKGGTPVDYWVTRDFPEYGKLMELVQNNREIFRNNLVLQNLLTNYDVYKKIDGFSVRAISKFMRMELISEVANISLEKIDPKMFMPPEDFKKIEKK